MRKLATLATVLGLLAIPAIAQAGLMRISGGSGRTTLCTYADGATGPCPKASTAAVEKPFTLSNAHYVAQRFEHWFFGRPTPTVGACHWDRVGHKAACAVSLTAVIVNGTNPVTFDWTDIVTHDNACFVDWCLHGLTVQAVAPHQAG